MLLEDLASTKRTLCYATQAMEPSLGLNYYVQKIRQTLAHHIRNHWTADSTLSYLISSVYRDISHWRSNQWPQSRNSTTKLQVRITPKRCRWDLIRSKQLSRGSVCGAQVFVRFSDHGNSIYNIIPLLKKRKCTTSVGC